MIAPEDDLELLNNEGESADESKFSSFFLGRSYGRIKELVWTLGTVLLCLMISALVFTYSERKWEIMQNEVGEGEEEIDFINQEKRKTLHRFFVQIHKSLEGNATYITMFTELAAGMCEYKKHGQYDYQWHFGGTLDYVIAILSTAGWGNIVPVTKTGKVVSVFYILLGLPIMLLFMYSLVDVLDSAVSALRRAFYNMLKGMEHDPDWWALYAVTAIFTSLLLLMILVVAGISVKRTEVKFSNSGDDIVPQWSGQGSGTWTFWDGLYFQVNKPYRNLYKRRANARFKI